MVFLLNLNKNINEIDYTLRILKLCEEIISKIHEK